MDSTTTLTTIKLSSSLKLVVYSRPTVGSVFGDSEINLLSKILLRMTHKKRFTLRQQMTINLK